MKSFLRVMTLLAVVAMVGFAPVANAQGGNCLPGLSAADCKLIEDANTNAGKQTSFTMDSFTVDLSVTGIPTGDVALKVKGSGGFDWSNLKTGGTPEEILAGVMAAIMFDASMKQGAMDQSGKIEMRIVEGFLYLKNPTAGATPEWAKVSLAKALENQMGELSGILSGATGMTDTSGAAALAAIPGLIQTSAADGASGTRSITTKVNLGALVAFFNSPEAMKSLGSLIPEEAALQISSLLPLFETALKSIKIELTQLYNKEAAEFVGMDLRISGEADAMLASMLSAQPGAKLNLEFSLRLSGWGKGYKVEPVAGAQEIDPAMLNLQ